METVSHNSTLTNYLRSTYNMFRPYMAIIRYERFSQCFYKIRVMDDGHVRPKHVVQST